MAKNTTQMPESIMTAATALLAPYVPGITADALKKAIGSALGATEAKPSLRPEYTRQEAAERLCVSLRTIDYYTEYGWLKAIKVGKRRKLLTAESVEAMLCGKTVGVSL